MMKNVVLFLLSFVLVADASHDLVVLKGAKGKYLPVRMLMASEIEVAFSRLSDGKYFVTKWDDLSELSQERITDWKRKQNAPKKPDLGKKKVSFHADSEFREAWRKAMKQHARAMRSASGRKALILAEKDYAKKLEGIITELQSQASILRNDAAIILSVSERKRLLQVSQYLRAHTLKQIRANLEKLEEMKKKKGSSVSIRKNPLAWPELPLFPHNGKVLNAVPHVTQLKNYCGPATSEMLLRYCGIDLDQRAIAKRISESAEEHRGTLTVDMALAIHELKVNCELVHSKEILGVSPKVADGVSEMRVAKMIRKRCFEYIKKKIDSGSPIITTVKHGKHGIGHFVCVIGYDHTAFEPTIYVRDPMNPAGSEPKKFELADFVKYWIFEYEGGFMLEAIVLGK